MSENELSQSTPTTHMTKKKLSSANRTKPLMDPLLLQTIGLNHWPKCDPNLDFPGLHSSHSSLSVR